MQPLESSVKARQVLQRLLSVHLGSTFVKGLHHEAHFSKGGMCWSMDRVYQFIYVKCCTWNDVFSGGALNQEMSYLNLDVTYLRTRPSQRSEPSSCQTPATNVSIFVALTFNSGRSYPQSTDKISVICLGEQICPASPTKVMNGQYSKHPLLKCKLLQCCILRISQTFSIL